jgi:hypothetical protein
MSNSEEFNKLFSSRKETEKLRGEKEELMVLKDGKDGEVKSISKNTEK